MQYSKTQSSPSIGNPDKMGKVLQQLRQCRQSFMGLHLLEASPLSKAFCLGLTQSLHVSNDLTLAILQNVCKAQACKALGQASDAV